MDLGWFCMSHEQDLSTQAGAKTPNLLLPAPSAGPSELTVVQKPCERIRGVKLGLALVHICGAGMQDHRIPWKRSCGHYNKQTLLPEPKPCTVGLGPGMKFAACVKMCLSWYFGIFVNHSLSLFGCSRRGKPC